MTVQNYSFTDQSPSLWEGRDGLLYYRLRQTDFDGKYEYFGPISVTCEPSDEWQLIAPSISPEGGEYVCTLLLPQDAVYKVEIIDLQGKTISLPFGEGRGGAKGSNLLHFDLKNLSGGVYFIKVSSQEKQLVKKFVKQ